MEDALTERLRKPRETYVGLSRHGVPELIWGTLLLFALSAFLGWVWWPLALLPLPVLAWHVSFFRDPNRKLPGDESHIWVSPADGKVTDVVDVAHDDLLGGPATRIGIFLSVFNVHVNRAPCRARVIGLAYKKGKFLNALKTDECSTLNEANTIVLGDYESRAPIAVVRQIAGLIARRIVCTPAVGDEVARGERIGLIKFGSRTELIVPKALSPEPLVKVGDAVRGASTPICRVTVPSAVGAAEAAPA